jgi:methylated-DNA-protein-cysteine methyltransferase related protein
MITLPDPAPFFRVAWEIVRQVPYGQVTTFKQIAEMIPTPPGVEADDYAKLGARWVGDAMNAVSIPDEPTVPWHRVINSKGGISLPETSKGAALQRARLLAEGVEFDSKERIDFDRFGWEGADRAWVETNGLLPSRSLRKPADDAPQQMSLF